MMSTLMAPAEARATAVGPRSGYLLRLSRPGHAERSFPLAGSKCTIGSSPRCHVCLPASDAKPIQCLLALGDAPLVTRWAAGVKLNDRDFATAPMLVGDQISIGPWLLELDREAPPCVDAEVAADRQTLAWESPEAPEFQNTALVETAPNDDDAPNADKAATSPEDESIHAHQTATRADEDSTATDDNPLAIDPLAIDETPPDEPESAEPQHVSLAAPWPVVPEFGDSEGSLAAAVVDLPLPNESAPPCPATRSANKTICIASRQTTPVFLPPAPHRPDAECAGFADRLILRLWTASYQHRRRCRILLTALREARANLALAGTQAEQLHHAYEAQSESWEVRRASLEAELAACSEERDRLSAELANFVSQAESDDRDEQLHHLNGRQAAAERDLSEVREQLAARDEEVAQLAEQNLSALAACSEWEQHVGHVQTRCDELSTECQRLAHEHAVQLAESESRRQSLEAQLAVLIAAPIHVVQRDGQAVADAPEPAEAEHQRTWPANHSEFEPAQIPATEATDQATEWADDHGWERTEAESSQAKPDWPAEEAAGAETSPVELDKCPEVLSEVSVEPDFEPDSAPAFVPTSFIDRYRHLLDDDAALRSEHVAIPARAVLDEEYLSPVQAAVHDSPADDSDEALEAYMSNLMRRVRSVSTDGNRSAATLSRPPAAPWLAPDENASEAESIEPIAISQATPITRRHQPPTDLAALREIANASARTAIAEHRQRRQTESVLSKLIISTLAIVAAVYAFVTAPGHNSPWFWAGTAAGALGLILTVQLMVLLRQQRVMRRRLKPTLSLEPQPVATASSPESPAAAAE